MEMAREGGWGAESWVERMVPWGSSFLMHAGIGLVVLFVGFVVMGQRAVSEPVGSAIAIPDLLAPPENRATMTGEEEKMAVEDRVKAMQNRLKEAANGADVFGKVDARSLTSGGFGERAGVVPDVIGVGKDGSFGMGEHPGVGGTGVLAPYGDRLVMGGTDGFLPRPTSRVHRIVYLLDHSGSMLDSFDYLRSEVIEKTRLLTPAQMFSVIMFSEEVEVLGPEALQRATPEVKGDVASRMRRIRAGGMNDGLLEPFQKGFEKAFAMKPELIIFLTDGNFDPRLVEVVRGLNKEHVHIETIAFVEIAPDSAESLKAIAREAGGKYKFVSAKDLK